ncbi:hypothetical protein Poli38472_012628 [Pythium oligandrum]|uniref:Chitin-binding type-4 domain-containing protein n=1 Tax=Pythium oligandrum TaxID=41045 RepID=A0A8K1CFX8_PYTOL|nr:hypothetical protein Poli38472_012628 [Pythium oligandrum]|eukprot:TMW61437.1 hypothetical protein Poli38472_012628 [Pythium oligandrum]
MKSVAALAMLGSSLMAAQVQAHGYMTVPTPRYNGTFSDPTDINACDSDTPGHVTEFKSGEEIYVEWTRNNHIGGFIRYSIVPKGEIWPKSNFDKNTFYYTCRETNCDLKQCKGWDCPDDPGSIDYQIKCSTKVKLPDYLPAGDYVMQWAWHSVGSSENHIGWSTGTYKSCADIRLTTSGTGSKPKCPTFVGGDRVMALRGKGNDQCLFFDDNGLDKDFVKYDDAEGVKRYFEGLPKEIEQCRGVSTSAPTQSSAPTPQAPTGKYTWIGDKADPKTMTEWCNKNCPDFCPSMLCKAN